MHNLIITEKPSVARTISKVLGATARRDGYLEGGGYLVSWCVGHLVELAPPGAYDPRLERWNRADLPILPERWQYLVSSSTKKQFDVLCKLMHRADVDRIVCATDAGREGELIFRLVYHQCGCRKPVSRLWISSMEDAAIRAGFENLKPSTEYDSLYKAALCRERADWLVGINATRLFSCLHGVACHDGGAGSGDCGLQTGTVLYHPVTDRRLHGVQRTIQRESPGGGVVGRMPEKQPGPCAKERAQREIRAPTGPL